MKIKVTYQVTIELDIDEAVIKETTSEDWRRDFYDFRTPSDVAEHVAFNFVANDVREVTGLDGFAHFKKDQVKYGQPEYGCVYDETHVIEEKKTT